MSWWCIVFALWGIALAMGSNTMGKGIPSGSKWMWKRRRVFHRSRGRRKLSFLPSGPLVLFLVSLSTHKSVDVASIFKRHLDFFFFFFKTTVSGKAFPGTLYIIKVVHPQTRTWCVGPSCQKFVTDECFSQPSPAAPIKLMCCHVFLLMVPRSAWQAQVPLLFYLKDSKRIFRSTATIPHWAARKLSWLGMSKTALGPDRLSCIPARVFWEDALQKGGVNSWRMYKIPFVLFGQKMFCSNRCNTSESLVSVHSRLALIRSYLCQAL